MISIKQRSYNVEQGRRRRFENAATALRVVLDGDSDGAILQEFESLTLGFHQVSSDKVRKARIENRLRFLEKIQHIVSLLRVGMVLLEEPDSPVLDTLADIDATLTSKLKHPTEPSDTTVKKRKGKKKNK